LNFGGAYFFIGVQNRLDTGYKAFLEENLKIRRSRSEAAVPAGTANQQPHLNLELSPTGAHAFAEISDILGSQSGT
jgi:hypothetical protein